MERKQIEEELFIKINQTLLLVFNTRFIFNGMMSYKRLFISPF